MFTTNGANVKEIIKKVLNVHSVINSSQHLHHELRIQQHAVARLPPKLLLLSREATNAHSEKGSGVRKKKSEISSN